VWALSPVRQFDCLKPVPEPSDNLWGNIFGGLDLIIGCSWLKWIESSPPSPVLAEFAIEAKSGLWPAVFPIEPTIEPDPQKVVKAVPESAWPRPPEPPPQPQLRYTCEQRYTPGCPGKNFAARVNGVWQIHDNVGGKIIDFMDSLSYILHEGGDVEVLGQCGSACTLVTAYIPRARLCFGKHAALAFHQARNPHDDSPSRDASMWMMLKYPDDIRSWLNAHGGVDRMTVKEYWMLPAKQLWQMGYRKCDCRVSCWWTTLSSSSAPASLSRSITAISGPICSWLNSRSCSGVLAGTKRAVAERRRLVMIRPSMPANVASAARVPFLLERIFRSRTRDIGSAVSFYRSKFTDCLAARYRSTAITLICCAKIIAGPWGQ
jgi:hypothetical protein